jgi:cytochrome c oxidase subunit 4
VFGALAVLTALTVGISHLDLSRTKAITAALLIAATKVSLIVAFFMHLKSEKKLIHCFFYTAIIFVLILFFLVLPDLT